MITIKETIIHGIRKNSNEDLFVTVHVKREDYSDDLEKELYREKREGSLFALGMQKADYIRTEDEVKTKRNSNLVYLNTLMTKYAEQENITLNTLKDTLYEKYSITSRKDLDDTELLEAIDSYRLGLYNN